MNPRPDFPPKGDFAGHSRRAARAGLLLALAVALAVVLSNYWGDGDRLDTLEAILRRDREARVANERAYQANEEVLRSTRAAWDSLHRDGSKR